MWRILKLRQILNADIADIAPYDQGFVYTEKKTLENGACKISFFSYDCETGIAAPITKRTYAELKFGANGNRIADELGKNGEFIFCESARFFNNLVVTLDRDGNFSIFSPKGSLLQQSELSYQNSPVCCPVAYEKTLWCVVPDRNAIINYSIEEGRVLLRIGGVNQSAFSHPESLSLILGKIYICNRDSGKIRTVQVENNTYAVADYRTFDEPVYKYFRIYDREYALLKSGVYEI